MLPEVEAQSPNHWTAREFQFSFFFNVNGALSFHVYINYFLIASNILILCMG